MLTPIAYRSCSGRCGEYSCYMAPDTKDTVEIASYHGPANFISVLLQCLFREDRLLTLRASQDCLWYHAGLRLGSGLLQSRG